MWSSNFEKVYKISPKLVNPRVIAGNAEEEGEEEEKVSWTLPLVFSCHRVLPSCPQARSLSCAQHWCHHGPCTEHHSDLLWRKQAPYSACSSPVKYTHPTIHTHSHTHRHSDTYTNTHTQTHMCPHARIWWCTTMTIVQKNSTQKKITEYMVFIQELWVLLILITAVLNT